MATTSTAISSAAIRSTRSPRPDLRPTSTCVGEIRRTDEYRHRGRRRDGFRLYCVRDKRDGRDDPARAGSGRSGLRSFSGDEVETPLSLGPVCPTVSLNDETDACGEIEPEDNPSTTQSREPAHDVPTQRAREAIGAVVRTILAQPGTPER